MYNFVPGQRWVSEMEPELGLGTLESFNKRRIRIDFNASRCSREYAISSAPLKRVRFSVKDKIESGNNTIITIEQVTEKNGILTYHGNDTNISETDLLDTISFTSPKDRLVKGFFDPTALFNLRYQTLVSRFKHKNSESFGFSGPRVELIPHQFHIAREVTSRDNPRILLSDETGLGKTIEAGLILHRFLLSEKISRVLILVPESLIHQWFVEFYRRFNLSFTIFDNDFCRSFEINEKNINPFLEAERGICSMEWLVSQKKRKQQVIAAKWDMLVIDEAHHLEENGESYRFIQNLEKNVPAMMLLTATPEQPGIKSYFASLKLLDPLRYHDFDLFLKENEKYRDAAKEIELLLKKEKTIDGLWNNEKSKEKAEEILDRHGPGRIIFKNTRAVVKGFPERNEHLYPL
ncbi:MAG: SNF2-related protein, partial [Thermodesulfobacteriota bacterium]|nr:SNF2-related protein [Thermodesulfobacteriota bacterium]